MVTSAAGACGCKINCQALGPCSCTALSGRTSKWLYCFLLHFLIFLQLMCFFSHPPASPFFPTFPILRRSERVLYSAQTYTLWMYKRSCELQPTSQRLSQAGAPSSARHARRRYSASARWHRLARRCCASVAADVRLPAEVSLSFGSSMITRARGIRGWLFASICKYLKPRKNIRITFIVSDEIRVLNFISFYLCLFGSLFIWIIVIICFFDYL